MAGESVGLDLASQSGQEDIKDAIEGLVSSENTLANAAGQSDIKDAIEGLVDEETGLADKAGQADIVTAIDGLIQGFANALNSAVLKTTDATVGTLTVTENGTYDAQDDNNADAYDEVVVNVPNTYVAADEGKVVDQGALVAQTARSSNITSNGTYDTTLNDEVTVAVDNSYAAGDEGKVVSSGALVSQSSATKTANGTYDTTLNNEIVVAIPAANGEVF